jgi:hypothetical protein
VAQKDTKKKATPTKGSREAKRVAPVSKRLLAGVAFLCAGGLLASAKLSNDWMAIAGCIVILTAGAVILEFAGRKEAEVHPHPLYEPGRLPSPESQKTKIFAIVLTVSLLLMTLAVAVGPNQEPSPFPFFLAAAYLFLILPQTQARRAMREYVKAHEGDESDEVEDKPKRKRKRKKHKH